MSKRYKALKRVEVPQDVERAIELVRENATAKFDETVEICFNLNILKKHNIRDTVVYPHSFGASPRVLVFAKGEKAEAAKEAGAEHVGSDDIIEKIADGWFEFDVAIATPDMMKNIAKIARILGTRGLMPNPKAKTVTDDVKTAVGAIKAGRKEFRANNDGVINFPVGKVSMDESELKENIREFYQTLLKKKPNDLKGDYIKSVSLSSTMGKGIRLDRKNLF